MTRSPSAYREKTRRLTLILLLIWMGVTFGCNAFAPQLNTITFIGFPFGFYLAAQGELLFFLLLIFIYNRRMQALDKEFGIEDE